MKIEFHGPAMCDYSLLQPDGTIEVEDGMTLKRFVKLVKLPLPWYKVFPLLVNYEKVPMDTILQDGDVVSAFTPMGGG